MLFRKKIEPRCAYCARGTQVNENEVVCVKRGVMGVGDHCHSFRYDPLRRVPPRPLKLRTDQLTPEDFSL